MFPFWKTLRLMSPDDGTGSGPANDELPEALKGKYVPLDKFNGTKGALEQQINRARSQADTLAGEKTALEGQLAQLSEQLTQFKTAAEAAKTLGSELETIKNSLTAQSAVNTRLRTALKYPALLQGELAESTLAFVESSTLDPEALNTHLGRLAGAVQPGTAPGPNPVAGATPPQPRPATVKPADLMNEAETARREGKIDLWREKMTEALSLLDADSPFTPPRAPANSAL